MTKNYSDNRWFVTGNSSYGTTHLIPLAYEHMLKNGRPLPVVGTDLYKTCVDSSLVKLTPLSKLFGRNSTAICLDIPHLIKMRALGFPSVLLYHSLIGKGKMLRGEKMYWPLFLAKHIIVAGKNQFLSLPTSQQRKAHLGGHLPNDWLLMPEKLLGRQGNEDLKRWRESPRPRVIFLSTRGASEVPKILSSISEWLNLEKITVAVKWHPGEMSHHLPAGILSINDIPVPILAKDADCVIGDHSSSLLEAKSAGAAVAVIETLLLKRLMAIKPSLREVAYAEHDIPVLTQGKAVASFITHYCSSTSSLSRKPISSFSASSQTLALLEDLI